MHVFKSKVSYLVVFKDKTLFIMGIWKLWKWYFCSKWQYFCLKWQYFCLRRRSFLKQTNIGIIRNATRDEHDVSRVGALQTIRYLLGSLSTGKVWLWRNMSCVRFNERNTNVCTECFTISYKKYNNNVTDTSDRH